MLARLRAEPSRAVGDALLDQRLVAGIGNIWKAESLWEARVSPWRPLADVSDEELARGARRRQPADAASVEGAQPHAARLPPRRPRVPLAAAP